MNRTRPSGFSLIEVAIALSIAGVVAAAATQASVLILKSVKHEGKRSSVDQDARRLVDFVVSNAQGAGGAAVRPWMALWHEESCGARHGLPACGGSDRLTIVDVDTARSSCVIVSATATSVTVEHAAAPDDALCCFDWATGAAPDDGSLNQIDGKAVVLVEDDRWLARVVDTAADNAGNCVINFASTTTHLGADTAVLSGGNNRPPLVGASTTIDHAAFAGGSVVIVRSRTLFVENNRLVEWNDDLDIDGAVVNDGIVQKEEKRVVFPGVFQLQVALGYDGNPEDGHVIEVPSTSDEWLGNVAADARPGAIRDDQLRMLRVGVIVGVKTTTPNGTAPRVLNGVAPTPAGHILRASQGTAFLRNLLLFY